MTPEVKNYVEMNQDAEFGKEKQEVIFINNDLLGYADLKVKGYLEDMASNLNKEIADKYDVSFMDDGENSLNEEEILKIQSEIRNRVAEFNNQITSLIVKHTEDIFLNEENFLAELDQKGITLQISDLNNEKINALTAYAQGLGIEKRMQEAGIGE